MRFIPQFPKPTRCQLLRRNKFEDALIVGQDLDGFLICETLHGELVRTLPAFVMVVDGNQGTKNTI